jgi:four helix bundle protein
VRGLNIFLLLKGSSAELYAQLTISQKTGYLNKNEVKYYMDECKEISAMLTNLIKSRSSN